MYEWWWHHMTAYNKKTGKPKSFFIEFFLMEGKYGMLKIGCWAQNFHQKNKQISVFFKPEECFASKKQMNVKFFKNEITFANASNNRLNGHIVQKEIPSRKNLYSDKGTVSFHILVHKFKNYKTTNIYFPTKLIPMYWYIGGLYTEFSGEIIWDDQTYEFIPKLSFGYQDKNWGYNYSQPWLWLQSSCILYNNEIIPKAAFACGGCTPSRWNLLGHHVIFTCSIPKIFSFEINFTKLKFDQYKFEWRNKSRWMLTIKNKSHDIVIDIQCPQYGITEIHYETPKGELRNVSNSGIGKGTLTINNVTFDIRHCGVEYSLK